MSDIVMGPHPDFDALSALADQDDAAAARSRTGRHVARCAVCRAEVAEIRALGHAARSWEAEPVADELWERIRVAATDQRASPDSTRDATKAMDVQPTHRPHTARWLPPSFANRPRMRRILGGAGILVALAVVALWPSRASLDATGTSRLTFTPGRPVPGGMMTVRYRPARWFEGAPTLVLAGRFVKPTTEPRESFVRARDGLDSLGTLRLMADGSYEARIRLPIDFLGVQMAVFDPSGTASDRDGDDLWMAIGGTRGGAPSLTSLIAS